MSARPTRTDLVRAGQSVVEDAVALRVRLRRRVRPGNPEREQALALGVASIAAVMAPIRSELGRAPYREPSSTDAELREVSRALQRERRKLWKMARRPEMAEWAS